MTEDVLVVSVGRFEKRRYVTIDSENDKIPSAHWVVAGGLLEYIYLFIYLFLNFAKDKLAGEISQN